MLVRVGDFVDYESLTVTELKDILRKGGLPVSGKKSELIRRISKNQSYLNRIAGYEKFTVTELKDILREADLPVSGKKFELIQRVSELQSNQSRRRIVMFVVLPLLVIVCICASLLLSYMIKSEGDASAFGANPIEAFFLVVIFNLFWLILPTRVKIFG